MGARGYSGGQHLYLSDNPPAVEVHLSREDSELFAWAPDLLTVKHLEVILDQSEKTVRKLIDDGVLPSVRIGERIFVPKFKLVEYVLKACGEVA